MSFRKVNEVEFKLSSVTTLGVTAIKYNGPIVPVSVDQDTADEISELASEHDAQNPVYTMSCNAYKVLYLGVEKLSERQTAELLNKGRLKVSIHFTLIGVDTIKDGTNYLRFKVTRLQKKNEA